MSVDADLATLREYAYIGAGVVMRRRREVKDANEGVEAELSRLREQREALKAECADWERGADEELARAWKERAEAAEARCARLQQALEARHRWLADALSRNQIVHETDRARARAFIADWEALAELDTPADSQEDKT